MIPLTLLRIDIGFFRLGRMCRVFRKPFKNKSNIYGSFLHHKPIGIFMFFHWIITSTILKQKLAIVGKALLPTWASAFTFRF